MHRLFITRGLKSAVVSLSHFTQGGHYTFASYDQICAQSNTCSAFVRTDHSLSGLLGVRSREMFEGEQQTQDGNVSRGRLRS